MGCLSSFTTIAQLRAAASPAVAWVSVLMMMPAARIRLARSPRAPSPTTSVCEPRPPVQRFSSDWGSWCAWWRAPLGRRTRADRRPRRRRGRWCRDPRRVDPARIALMESAERTRSRRRRRLSLELRYAALDRARARGDGRAPPVRRVRRRQRHGHGGRRPARTARQHRDLPDRAGRERVDPHPDPVHTAAVVGRGSAVRACRAWSCSGSRRARRGHRGSAVLQGGGRARDPHARTARGARVPLGGPQRRHPPTRELVRDLPRRRCHRSPTAPSSCRSPWCATACAAWPRRSSSASWCTTSCSRCLLWVGSWASEHVSKKASTDLAVAVAVSFMLLVAYHAEKARQRARTEAGCDSGSNCS